MWRSIALFALLGTALSVLIVAVDLQRTKDEFGGVMNPGPDGPATAVVLGDFPYMEPAPAGRHDGPMFYAIARQPMHLDAVAESLDRPSYRLQRPLFPWLAWALHPSGGGPGLLDAFLVIGVLSLVGGGVAAGAVSAALGGPAWPALAFPLLPGCFVSLRITTPDTLAMALVLAAVYLSFREKPLLAMLAAVAAVLARDQVWLVLAGFAIWRRDRQGIALALVPAAVAGAWALFLRSALPPSPHLEVVEFSVPFRGLARSLEAWATGGEAITALAVVAALGLGVVALVRNGMGHPLSWAIVLNLLLLSVMNVTVLSLIRNGTRATLPLLVLAILSLATPRRSARHREQCDHDEPAGSGRDEGTQGPSRHGQC